MERAVLTNRVVAASWSSAFVRAAAVSLISAAMLTSASATGVSVFGCAGGWRGFNCAEQWGIAGHPYIRAVPEPISQAEKAQAAARERRWLTRCNPTVERDAYGVARYQYAAPGCEYGIGGD
jgi:hypothetical protein